MAQFSTNRIIDHLVEFHHFDRDGSKIQPTVSKKRKGWSFEAWSGQQDMQNTVFDEEGWKSTYCRWVVGSGISLRQASSDDLKALLCFQNPRIMNLVPQSMNTTRSWIMAEFENHKQTIVKSIASARGKVTISFDGWKANNEVLDLLGVIVHYLGDDNKLHNVVLAMRSTLGSHTGANIADQLFDVLKDYQISGSQISFFAADNATNNDKALQYLSERVTLDPITSRLRCAGHIYNLVCTAILFGVDEGALEDAQYDFSQPHVACTQAVDNFETTLSHGNEQERHVAWLRKGPVGKLHNLVTHVKGSNARIGVFEGKQLQANLTRERERDDETSSQRLLRLVNNGGIRWNSTYLMIERAIHLRDALTLYQIDEGESMNKEDLLEREDWDELNNLRDLLAPIHEVSMHVQSVGSTAGALHNTLTSMEYLLQHLETRRAQPNTKYYNACLNAGWLKLRKYYQLSDLNPAYIMAVFLNPHHRDVWFEDHWLPKDYKAAMKVIDQQYAAAKRLYNTDAPERSSTSPQANRKDLSGYAAFNQKKRAQRQTDPQDELAKYRSITDPPHGQDPLDWWILNADNYPVLRHLALTLLAAPASTAAVERLFSIAGNLINEQRPHTQQQLAEAVQCLRSWHAEGII